MNKYLVMIPTYNERDSIKAVLDGIEKRHSVLLIDDNSPDKTADYVKSLQLKNVDILHRDKKGGLGSAYKAGIQYALANPEITHLVSMDADGSHRPIDLIKLIEVSEFNPDATLIMGSRWIPGGAIVNWPRIRKWISKSGTWYAKRSLKLAINDLTGGFRIYSRKALEQIDLEQITSNGYCYQIEMAFALSHLQGRIIEVPITFIERAQGSSKMSQRIVLEAILKVTRLGFGLRLNPTADKLHYVK